MPEVNVEINGRKYRMACEEGQEAHLVELARRFNASVEELKGSFGEIGDNRLTVMAGIAALDDLFEAERRMGGLSAEVERLRRECDTLAAELDTLQERFARKMAETARKVEAIATAIDETGAPAGPAEG